MPRKTRQSTLKKTLTISKENYDRILMWSQSEKEIVFICLGIGNSIKTVVRMCNISRTPKNYCLLSEIHYKSLIKSYKTGREKILAHGHSHPQPYHDKHPSIIDVKNAEIGEIEIIAFPSDKVVLAWRISSSIKRTLSNEITLHIY